MFNMKVRSALNIFIVLVAAFAVCTSASAEELLTAKGIVKGFANPDRSRTISVNIEGGDLLVFKYTPDTIFRNFGSLQELKDETVSIEYKAAGHDRVATAITKSLVTIPEGVSLIGTTGMAELVRKGPVAGNYFIVDSRPAKRYEEGHLPGAVSIPVSEVEEKGAAMLPPDKEVSLIFYDGGPTCGMSPVAAEYSRKLGYRNILIYLDGEPAWSKAGYYTISTAEFIKDNNVLLIDLRPAEKVKKGHIPGAVNIPTPELLDAKDKFPAYKGADIVFYSDRMDDLIFAVKTSLNWGYRKSTIFLGGTGAWELVGNSLEKGPAAREITYRRVIPEGEISIQDFKNSLGSENIIVLDVRNRSEYIEGHIPGAANIPVDDITSRLAELPKDRMVLTYCITGVRAEIAYSILREQGYNVRFLNAAPSFNEDGSYTISE